MRENPPPPQWSGHKEKTTPTANYLKKDKMSNTKSCIQKVTEDKINIDFQVLVINKPP